MQDARKSAGYQIDDRIEIAYSADPERHRERSEAFATTCRTETLADDSMVHRDGSIDQLEPES